MSAIIHLPLISILKVERYRSTKKFFVFLGRVGCYRDDHSNRSHRNYPSVIVRATVRSPAAAPAAQSLLTARKSQPSLDLVEALKRKEITADW